MARFKFNKRGLLSVFGKMQSALTYVAEDNWNSALIWPVDSHYWVLVKRCSGQAVPTWDLYKLWRDCADKGAYAMARLLRKVGRQKPCFVTEDTPDPFLLLDVEQCNMSQIKRLMHLLSIYDDCDRLKLFDGVMAYAPCGRKGIGIYVDEICPLLDLE